MNEEKKIGLTQEDVEQGRETEFGLSGLFRAMGDDGVDALALARSPEGLLMQEAMAVMGNPEGSPEDIAYWRDCEKGLHKELHGDPADKLNRWASYIPLAAERDHDRRFPLIFCLHGAHNPIKLTESYGVARVAAREECIVIAPENENLDNILSLYEYAKAHYPVDLSRVYSVGYSFGGFMSARNTLSRPDIFAAAGMGGMLFAGSVKAHDLDGQWYTEFALTDEILKNAAAHELPALIFLGEREMLKLMPLHRELPMADQAPDGAIPLDTANKYAALNAWRAAGGCSPIEVKAPEFYAQHADPVVRSIGAEFERTEVRTYNDRRYFIGDSVNASGETMLRFVSVEGMVHWPTTVFADLVWEHISKYARDLDTGALIRL